MFVSSIQDANGKHTTKGGGNTYADKYLGFNSLELNYLTRPNFSSSKVLEGAA